jgi:hypothetical protein
MDYGEGEGRRGRGRKEGGGGSRHTGVDKLIHRSYFLTKRHIVITCIMLINRRPICMVADTISGQGNLL